MVPFGPYAVVLLISAVVAALVAVMAWRRRADQAPATALAVMMAGVVLAASMEVVGLVFRGGLGTDIWVLLIYPGAATAVAGFFRLCRLMAAGSHARRSRRPAVLLALAVGAVTVATLIKGVHGVLTGTIPPDALGMPDALFGGLFWAYGAYTYLLIGWAIASLAAGWRRSTDLQRRQLRTVLAGVVVAMSCNVLSLVNVRRAGAPDLTATAFAVSGLIAWWALFRQGDRQLVPIARAVVLERVSDAVVVIDLDGRILDLNPAAERLVHRWIPTPPADLIGLRLRDLATSRELSEIIDLRDSVQEPGTGGEEPEQHGPEQHGPEQHGEYRLRAGDEEIDLDVRAGRLTDRRGGSIGHVIVVRDITELSRRRRELTAANGRLREQLLTIDRLRADLAEQAARDPLTGLHNRRHLMRRLEDDLRRAAENTSPLALVLLDIDHFKAVNDRHGHGVGDELLVATARCLAGMTRTGDTLSRYGGEEFVVLLPGATMEEARDRADEWRRTCAAVAVPSPSGPVGATFSAGVAAFPACGTMPEALLQAADEALYAAKAAGRDQVLTARPLLA